AGAAFAHLLFDGTHALRRSLTTESSTPTHPHTHTAELPGLAIGRPVLQIAVNRRPDAGREVHLRPEAELFRGAVRIQAAARLSVGLTRVPFDLAAVADRIPDHAHKLSYRDLAAGAEVHRFGRVVERRRAG